MLRFRRYAALGASLAMVAGFLGTTAGPAAAATLFTCGDGGSGSSEISPGLTNTPQNETFGTSNNFFLFPQGCTDPNHPTGAFVANNSASQPVSHSPQPNNACVPNVAKGTILQLGTQPSQGVTIFWLDTNNSSTANLKLKAADPSAGREWLFVATITSGAFFDPAHKTKMKATLAWTVGAGDCTNGVTSVNLAAVSGFTMVRK